MGGRRIAIIGSGQAGLVAAHALVRKGHEVTVYSDRSADEWLNNSRPTGTAARFELALAYERELGLAHWEDVAPKMVGVHLSFCPKVGNRLVTMAATIASPALPGEAAPPNGGAGSIAAERGGQAVDLRLQSHRWLNDLGDRVVVENVSPDRLDAIAGEHELTLVATGRGPLAELFKRNAERSVYDKPQRKLAMVIVKNVAPTYAGVPFVAAKFNTFADAGEAFYIPYWHRDHGATSSLIFEARPGGPIDRFDGCKTGHEVVTAARAIIDDIVPWDSAWFREAELADDNGWLTGAVTPTVRDPVGRLPSGRIVMPLGDTAISVDPIAGQGANIGNKMAHHVVDAITDDGALDAAWMTRTFNSFWSDHGAASVRFTNLFLEPMAAGGQLMLIAQYGTNGIGDSP